VESYKLNLLWVRHIYSEIVINDNLFSEAGGRQSDNNKSGKNRTITLFR